MKLATQMNRSTTSHRKSGWILTSSSHLEGLYFLSLWLAASVIFTIFLQTEGELGKEKSLHRRQWKFDKNVISTWSSFWSWIYQTGRRFLSLSHCLWSINLHFGKQGNKMGERKKKVWEGKSKEEKKGNEIYFKAQKITLSDSLE